MKPNLESELKLMLCDHTPLEILEAAERLVSIEASMQMDLVDYEREVQRASR